MASLLCIPPHISRVPPPVAAECVILHRDVDSQKKGFTTVNDILHALRVNGIDLTPAQWDAFRDALMSRSQHLPEGIVRAYLGDRLLEDEDCAAVSLEWFTCCFYALSLSHREVQKASVYAVFPDSDFTVETATRALQLKRAMWAIVDQPNSSYMATLVAYFLVAVILLSVGVFIADSYPEVAEANDRAFNAIELFCVIVFTIEYGVRCLCAPEPRRFIFSFFNVVDLLSIAPYYIELMFGASGGSGAPMLRMVRLIRVVRLAKIGRYVTWLQIFGVTIQRSANALCMLFFIVGLLILFWATLVYFAERGAWDVERGVWQREDGSPTSFESIPAVAWCIIVSMSVVGFGDMAATTAVGRLITGAAIFSGIVMLAVPVPIITGYLHTEYDHVQRIAALKKQHAETEAVRAAAAAAEAGVESVSGGTSGHTSPQHVVDGSPLPQMPGGSATSAASATQSRVQRRGDRSDASAHSVPAPDLAHPVTEAAPGALSLLIKAPASQSESWGTVPAIPLLPTKITIPQADSAGWGTPVVTPAIMLDHSLSTPALSHVELPHSGGSRPPAPSAGVPPQSTPQERQDASWSEPFLHTMLTLVLSNRRELMASLKAAELVNRESITSDVHDFVADMANTDRAKVILKNAVASGFI